MYEGKGSVKPNVGGLNSVVAGACDVHHNLCGQSTVECGNKYNQNLNTGLMNQTVWHLFESREERNEFECWCSESDN